MSLYSRESDPSKPPQLSDPSSEELLAQLSINPTPEQLKEIIKRLHADNKALHTLHDQAVERGDEEADAYQGAWDDYWEEREKNKEARGEKAELQGKFDELQGNYDSQAEEIKKYKGLTATHFQRAKDAELELATRDNELNEALERIALLERQGVQTTDYAAIAQVQAQEDVDMQMNDVEMEDE
jgi:chromosome segregation ATPase